MKYFEFYDKTKTYYTVTGAIMTPEIVAQEHPAVNVLTHVVETDKNHVMMYGFDTLAILEQVYEIPEELTDEEALALITEKANTVNIVVPEDGGARIEELEKSFAIMLGE